MDVLDIMLEQVKKTNKNMTKERLMEELEKNIGCAMAFALICMNEIKK